MRISPKAAERELARRRLVKKPEAAPTKVVDPFDLLKDTFPEQRAAILDPAKFKSIFCTRRAAKSYTDGLYLFKEALETPEVSVLYVALTKDSARKIMVKDVLKPINRKYGINAKYSIGSLTFTLPNGSVIYLLGADADEDEKEKLLGQKYKLVVIDEAASFTINMRDLVYKILKPAVADYRGTIAMSGTPSNLITNSLFFDVTNGLEPGWSLHKWDTFANPYMADNWRAEIEDLKKINPFVVDTPWFKQMYLGQWVVDLDNLVYKFRSSKNEFLELPQLRGEWIHLLGVDLGYDDDSAFVVVSYNEHDKTLYVLDVFKKTKMDINDVSDKIKALEKKYTIAKTVIDGSNKQAVETMKNRHGLILEAADKRGKVDFIQLMNADFISGMIKVHSLAARPLIDEYLGLIWNPKTLAKEEHPNCPNHCTDAALYIWRYCYNFMSAKPKAPPAAGSPEWAQAQEDEMRRRMFEQVKAEQEATQDPFGLGNGNGWDKI